MPPDTNGPWAALSADEALRCVRHSIAPRWEAWTVNATESGLIGCARRIADGALTHGDNPGRLLEHIAYTDDDFRDQRG